MKTKKKDYTVPCTIVCKMQMEGVMVSASPLSLSENTGVLHDANTGRDTDSPGTGDEYGDGEITDAAKKNNLFYDEE